ncbi:MAG TPA: STAS domain-containing protein [Terriglobales bacterium]|nr:STAS domain-containing protein [Terriglobales bacterium]
MRITKLRTRAQEHKESIMLHVTVGDSGQNVVLHCIGKIVRGYETALLCTAARQHGRSVILDLTNVEAIDAAGVGALISLQAAGIYVQLLNPSRSVREVLHVTHLDTVFEIYDALPARHPDEMRLQQISNSMLVPLQAI